MGDAANASRRRRLSSILLSRKPRLTDSTNKTTAKVESRDGLTMAVSFWMADPPQLSLFSIHCSKPPDSQDGPYSTEFSDLPHVVGVGAEGRFVLIRAVFDRRATSEYFLYKAGEPPLLDRIPSPYEYYGDDGDDLRGVREFGVLQLGSHYLVAALCLAPSSDDYHLWIYSSERKSWSTRTLPNPCPGVHRIRPDKVITLGEEGLLGWVDLSHGLLMCDLRQDHSMSFIPLPEPLPGNRYKLHCPIAPPTAKRKKKLEDESHPNLSWFRDLACVDGVLKFIEMENVAPGNRSDKDDVIYDLDLIMSLERKAEDWNSKQLSFGGAWRAVTWTRTVSSNCWRQTCAADVADILVDDGSVHSSLLPGLGKKLTFRDLYSAFPILSPDGDDILYLKSVLEPSIQDGWVAAVDLGNKTVKAIGKYYLPDDFYYEFRHDPQHPFHACTLSRHLDMTPGIEVSACRKITEEASSSANHPSYTSIRVGELNSCEPRSIIQRPLNWTKKNKRARNAAGSIMQNDHISQQLDEKVLELEREVERELGWKKEQKTQQQCFKKWDAPCYPPGHLLWPQNNLPAQQYFNKPDGPCGPGYASLASVHGRHNYQPLWQQPPPLKQQLTYSSEFRPHEVPQPSFNNRSGASYHWYSQQLSAPNSFAYGAHTGYGNYQHQWEQLPITLEMPIASWEHPPPPLLCHPTPSENPCAFQTEI